MKFTFVILSALLGLLLTVQPRSAADEKKVELTADEQAIVDMTNKERAKKGLPALVVNPILCKVARGHSANMAKQNKMEHVLDGKTPGKRTTEGGYEWEVVGENVGTGDKNWTIPQLMNAWMKSPAHRENILHNEFTEIGVGIGRTAKGDQFFTQLFAAPLK